MTYQVQTAVKNATPSDNPNTQPATLDTLPTDGFIRVMPLAQRLGIHHQTLRRWWKTNKFPCPQTRNGILLFSNADVKEWINNQPLVIE
nr:helix-turn-helix domain-containing protein [Moraxella sp.]